jgi:hypothetical protein
MRTFEQWLREDAPAPAAPAPAPQTQQPQQQQPQQNTQQAPSGQELPIMPGMEPMHVQKLMRKLQANDTDIAEELGPIFQSAAYYLSNGGAPKVQQFLNTIKQGLKGNTMEKYMDDAEQYITRNKVWDGSVPPLAMYDPAWAAKAFSQDGDADSLAGTVGELMGNIGRITQGKTQSSVFSQ